jgi:hypothetical protein
MKLVKSLLLGSAAGLVAVAGANAADLPARQVAAVEYVRVCSTYGAGFFYIPGTETCLRVGGRVRADALYAEPFSRAQDVFGIRVRGRLNVDARTATAYGTLRTYIRYEITQNSGSPFGNLGTFSNTPSLTQAFVQFGGLTAGKVTSFFDNPDLPTSHFGTLRFSDAPDIALFAYTFSFGNGFSATLSLEDGLQRRIGSSVALTFDPVTGEPLTFGNAYGGQTAPDLVGNVRYAGTWGSAQLAGAVHQNRSIFPDVDTDYGFAVMGTVGINLPMLGASDSAWLAATYADGALGYLGLGQNTAAGNARGIASDIFTFPDETTQNGKGWSIAGGLQHYWVPTLSSSIFGSWADINFSGRTTAFFGNADFREYRIGANTIWRPVSGLQLGLEVIYANVDASAGFRGDSATEGRIRVQRDF